MTSENISEKSSQLNERYKLYELIDMNRGGIYHDFTHGIENRRGFWGFQPYYPPNDEPGFVNEEFVRFVESKDDYLIRRPIFHIATLTEEFKKAITNLSEYINKANNTYKFYKNLRKLQEYLSECGYFKGDGILQEREIELTSKKNTKLSKEEADNLAYNIANKLNLSTPEHLGSGEHGHAYDISSKTVMKITSEESEAVEAMKLRGKKLQHLADVYSIYRIEPIDENNNDGLYVILQEKLNTSPEINQELRNKIERLRYVFENILDLEMEEVLGFHGEDQYEQHEEKIDAYMKKNPQDAQFFNQLMNIRNDLKKAGSISIDFMSPTNLGYKEDGTLAFFDVGFGDIEFGKEKPRQLQVREDGSTKFSTDTNVGGDQFPAYNQKSSEPVIDNNRDANSFSYHDNSFFTYENKELSEEYLGDLYFFNRETPFQVFKNPKSIKKLKSNVRGIITENGDLYVIDDDYNIIHNQFATWLNDQGYPIPKDVYNHLNEIVPVQRYENSNKFYLSESISSEEIDKFKEKFQQTFERAKKKNPTINFVMENIDFADSDDEMISEEYLGDYYINSINASYEVFRNPKSIKRLMSEIRGIVVENGDLYVIDDNDEVIHNELSNWLHYQGYPVPENVYRNLNKAVPVQRYENTNKFYLGESIPTGSIPSHRENFENIFKKAKEKNPTINFILQNIVYAESDDETLNEELKKSKETKFDDTEYKMDVEDDTFIHFAPKEVAQEIAKSKKLDPKFSETFADSVFAISLTYGEYVPTTQIHNIGGKRSENYEDYIGIVFKTNDIPKVGHVEEVSWEGPVNINILKYVTIKEAENMLNNTPYNINERDYVLYESESNINERQKAWIPGSKAVKVKQKCRLGGLNGTSVACNQGDISNLEFSSLDEETKLDQGFVDGWHRYDILHDDEVAGEMEVSNRDKFMVLNRIYINPEHRGMGHAKDAMKILIDYADANNKIIALTPDNVWGASKEKLRKWYSSLGFVRNKGRHADYRIQAAMIRRPQNNKIKETVDPKSVNTNEKSIQSVIDGKRGVGFVSLVDDEWKEKVKNAKLKMLGPIHQKHHNGYENQMYVIFNPNISNAEEKARELFTIALRNNGYVNAKSPEGVRRIGELLDYNKEAIDAFIKKRFGEKEISENIRKNQKESLNLSKNDAINESKYSDTKDSILSSKSIPKEKKEEIIKYLGSGSSYKEGKVYGLQKPKVNGKSFNGVSLGADKNGFFVYTHRARSKSKESPDKIPQKDIDFIESTG